MPEDEFKLKAIFEIDERSIAEIQRKLAEGLQISTSGITGTGGGGTSTGEKTPSPTDILPKVKDVTTGLEGLKDVGKNLQGMLGEKGFAGLSEIGSKLAPGMSKAVSGVMKMGEAGAELATKGAGALTSALGGSAGGGAIGATLGSIAPGVGTAIGLAVGVAMGPVLEDVMGPLMDFAKEASPMIESVMTLMQTTMMLFVRPFADFLMLILMPVMIFIMKYIAVPFYQYVYPMLMDLYEIIKPYIPDLAKVIIVIMGVLLVLIAIVSAPLLSLVMGIIELVVLAVILWRLYEKLMNWLFEVIPQIYDFIMGTIWEKGLKPVLDWIIRMAGVVIGFVVSLPGLLWDRVISPAVEFVWSALMTVWEFIKGLLMPVVNWVVLLATEVVGFIGRIISNIWEKIILPVLEDIWTIILHLWELIKVIIEPFVAIARSLWEWIKDKFQMALDWVKEKLKDLWDVVKTVWDWLSGILNRAIDFVWGLLEDVWGLVDKIWTWFGDVLQGALDWVKTKLGELWETIKGVPGMIWDKIVAGAEWLKTTIIQPIIDIVQSVVGGVKTVIDTIITKISDIYTKLVDNVIATIDSIKGWVEDLYDVLGKVKDKIENLNPLHKTEMIGAGYNPLTFGGGPKATTINLHQTVDGYVDPRQLAESANRQFVNLASRVMRG